MPYMFFYASLFTIWIVFALISHTVRLNINHLLIGIATVAYSAVFDTVLGTINGLYYYVSPGESQMYIILAALLIYPFVNIIYVAFLPEKTKEAIVYTVFWIAAMLLFEYFSVITRTIVFTGWRPFPWSVIAYILTYAWVIPLYNYSSRKYFYKGSNL